MELSIYCYCSTNILEKDNERISMINLMQSVKPKGLFGSLYRDFHLAADWKQKKN